MGWAVAAKACFDRVAAAVGLAVLAPIFAVVAVLVRVNLGAGVLFRQRRPGLRGRPFELVKFRTMTDARDAAGRLLPDQQRLTRFGKFLRSTSLDELPQLWNVLRGELSLVGPRPLLMQYLDRYSPRQARRHDVMPGITGWSQVNGRNAIDWPHKLELDVWYVEHWTLWLDAKILGKTVLKVLGRSGVLLPGEATTCEFMGTSAPLEDAGARRAH